MFLLYIVHDKFISIGLGDVFFTHKKNTFMLCKIHNECFHWVWRVHPNLIETCLRTTEIHVHQGSFWKCEITNKVWGGKSKNLGGNNRVLWHDIKPEWHTKLYQSGKMKNIGSETEDWRSTSQARAWKKKYEIHFY